MNVRRLLLCALLTATGCTSAEPATSAKHAAAMMSAAADLRHARWATLTPETSLVLLRRHFDYREVMKNTPGPAEDAGSVTWKGEMGRTDRCRWCVVLLESKPSTGGVVERANFFLSGESRDTAVAWLDRLTSILLADGCEGRIETDLAAQVKRAGRGRVSCWPKPTAPERQGADVELYEEEGRWQGFVSYWQK